MDRIEVEGQERGVGCGSGVGRVGDVQGIRERGCRGLAKGERKGGVGGRKELEG